MAEGWKSSKYIDKQEVSNDEIMGEEGNRRIIIG